MNPFQALRDARLAAGLSYGDVAQGLGVGWTALAHYEAGRRTPASEIQDRWRTSLKLLLAARASSIANHLAAI